MVTKENIIQLQSDELGAPVSEVADRYKRNGFTAEEVMGFSIPDDTEYRLDNFAVAHGAQAVNRLLKDLPAMLDLAIKAVPWAAHIKDGVLTISSCGDLIRAAFKLEAGFTVRAMTYSDDRWRRYMLFMKKVMGPLQEKYQLNRGVA